MKSDESIEYESTLFLLNIWKFIRGLWLLLSRNKKTPRKTSPTAKISELSLVIPPAAMSIAP